MLGHYLLTLYRSLSRHRLYAAINVLGLAVGIAVFLVLFLDVRFETSFERWIPNADQVYLVRTQGVGQLSKLGTIPYTMGDLLDQLRADYHGLVGARVSDDPVTVRQGDRSARERIARVDPTFFQVFDLPLVAGDKATILSRPDDLVLTERKARQYFGVANPIGRQLSVVDGQPHLLRIVGVLKDLPKTTELPLEFITPLKIPTPTANRGWRRWSSFDITTYLRVATPDQARALNASFAGFIHRRAPPDMARRLALGTLPLVAVHLANPRDAAMVATLGAVGVLTLMLAVVNYVNLATARSGLRAREVAVRKTMGATRAALIAQFMAEAWATAALGALLGLALCELALPLVNAAGGLSLRLDYASDPGLIGTVLLVVIAVGFGAGAYPALILSQFQPAGVLASAKTPGGGGAGGRVREALVVCQFAVAIAFAVATSVIVSQTRFLRHADIGFNREGLIVVSSFDLPEVTGAQRASLLAAWRTLPHVTSATAGDIAPGIDESDAADDFKRPGQPGDGAELNWVSAGPDFFQTYGARLIAGRLPDLRHGDDYTVGDVGSASQRGGAPNVVLNALAVRALGFKSPDDAIGNTVLAGAQVGNGYTPLKVIGVVRDIRFRSPRQPVPPTLYYGRAGDLDDAAAGIRYTGADANEVLHELSSAWRGIVPAAPFQAFTSDQTLGRYFDKDNRQGHLFSIGAALAILIGCIGLYGLASFNTARRVKEIGIRKTLGASTTDILKLLIGQFLRPVILSNLFAWPLAWWTATAYLSGFDQRIALTPTYFLAATALTLLIAVGTVAGQAYAVARAEPAKALRHE